MYTLKELPEFTNWFASLKDHKTKLRILARLARVENGNFGDHKTVEGELKELRMTFGGGVRIYYVVKGSTIVLLAHGGNKSTQQRDIEKAKDLINNLEDNL